ncbi:MAG: hypothetical protein OQL20_05635, partial [Sedimenticola sp.]|nr:hypothetical protein [Sedimenticola sp.]
MNDALDPASGFISLESKGEIVRYWDKDHGCPAAKLRPGDFYITQENEIITTVLGSCIAVCIRDDQRGVAGMNHFMLPLSADGQWGGVGDPL